MAKVRAPKVRASTTMYPNSSAVLSMILTTSRTDQPFSGVIKLIRTFHSSSIRQCAGCGAQSRVTGVRAGLTNGKTVGGVLRPRCHAGMLAG
ncbi:hypothetical protein GCM10010840_24030 [Deinococcus aerolatus]|uniref:Uncharacterized protein n=1 Tax=Deinococcus aerolatus TaxID=522487 RepID=A0ABQ2GBQ0_9DEIO|nr:hypothetical protein GCM10010840_24030 [Deinococcus aerolatus]